MCCLAGSSVRAAHDASRVAEWLLWQCCHHCCPMSYGLRLAPCAGPCLHRCRCRHMHKFPCTSQASRPLCMIPAPQTLAHCRCCHGFSSTASMLQVSHEGNLHWPQGVCCPHTWRPVDMPAMLPGSQSLPCRCLTRAMCCTFCPATSEQCWPASPGGCGRSQQ